MNSPWFAYAAPVLVYAGISQFEGSAPPESYPLVYCIKLGLTIAVALLGRRSWQDLRPAPSPGVIAAAIGLGLLTYGVWIGVDRLGLVPNVGSRAGFDPGNIADSTMRVAFLAARFTGLVLVVPLVEELFFRSFLIRLAEDPDHGLEQPPGSVALRGALISGVLFALAHPEWLAAALTAALYTALLARTRSVAACVTAHGVTNLALGIHVLATGEWRFW